MSSIPLVASAADVPRAVRYAERNPSARWYVARRAASLGYSDAVPAEWLEAADLTPVVAASGKVKKPISAIAKMADALWDAALHPRGRDGKFIEKGGAVDISVPGWPPTRGRAVGVRKDAWGNEVLSVLIDPESHKKLQKDGHLPSGPEGTSEPISLSPKWVTAAPDQKANLPGGEPKPVDVGDEVADPADKVDLEEGWVVQLISEGELVEDPDGAVEALLTMFDGADKEDLGEVTAVEGRPGHWRTAIPTDIAAKARESEYADTAEVVTEEDGEGFADLVSIVIDPKDAPELSQEFVDESLQDQEDQEFDDLYWSSEIIMADLDADGQGTALEDLQKALYERIDEIEKINDPEERDRVADMLRDAVDDISGYSLGEAPEGATDADVQDLEDLKVELLGGVRARLDEISTPAGEPELIEDLPLLLLNGEPDDIMAAYAEADSNLLADIAGDFEQAGVDHPSRAGDLADQLEKVISREAEAWSYAGTPADLGVDEADWDDYVADRDSAIIEANMVVAKLRGEKFDPDSYAAPAPSAPAAEPFGTYDPKYDHLREAWYGTILDADGNQLDPEEFEAAAAALGIRNPQFSPDGDGMLMELSDERLDQLANDGAIDVEAGGYRLEVEGFESDDLASQLADLEDAPDLNESFWEVASSSFAPETLDDLRAVFDERVGETGTYLDLGDDPAWIEAMARAGDRTAKIKDPDGFHRKGFEQELEAGGYSPAQVADIMAEYDRGWEESGPNLAARFALDRRDEINTDIFDSPDSLPDAGLVGPGGEDLSTPEVGPNPLTIDPQTGEPIDYASAGAGLARIDDDPESALAQARWDAGALRKQVAEGKVNVTVKGDEGGVLVPLTEAASILSILDAADAAGVPDNDVLHAGPAVGVPGVPEAPVAPDAPTAPNSDYIPGADTPQAKLIYAGLYSSASNKGIDVVNAGIDQRLDALLLNPDREAAHKELAGIMTQLKLGGKQRKRYREMLDEHFGVDPDGSGSDVDAAKTISAGLASDNPLKAKLDAKIADLEAPLVSTPEAPAAPGAPDDAPKPIRVKGFTKAQTINMREYYGKGGIGYADADELGFDPDSIGETYIDVVDLDRAIEKLSADYADGTKWMKRNTPYKQYKALREQGLGLPGERQTVNNVRRRLERMRKDQGDSVPGFDEAAAKAQAAIDEMGPFPAVKSANPLAGKPKTLGGDQPALPPTLGLPAPAATPATPDVWPGPAPKPGAKIYTHPQGARIYVNPDGSMEAYGANGKKKNTTATPENLATGHGKWTELKPSTQAPTAKSTNVGPTAFDAGFAVKDLSDAELVGKYKVDLADGLDIKEARRELVRRNISIPDAAEGKLVKKTTTPATIADAESIASTAGDDSVRLMAAVDTLREARASAGLGDDTPSGKLLLAMARALNDDFVTKADGPRPLTPAHAKLYADELRMWDYEPGVDALVTALDKIAAGGPPGKA